MSTSTPNAEQIQRQMQQVRTELRDNVRELVESAREMTVWQRYVQAYPWTCLGAAALAGYLIVPTRTRMQADPALIAELVKHQVAQQTSSAKPGAGLVSGLVSGVASLALKGLLQGGIAILSKQLNRYVERTLHGTHEPHSNGEAHNHA